MAQNPNKKMDIHSFYCPKCGNKAMDLLRPQSLKRGSFHRKKLYCPTCRGTYNCIECQNIFEVLDFKEDFENGVYADEAQEYLE